MWYSMNLSSLVMKASKTMKKVVKTTNKVLPWLLICLLWRSQNQMPYIMRPDVATTFFQNQQHERCSQHGTHCQIVVPWSRWNRSQSRIHQTCSPPTSWAGCQENLCIICYFPSNVPLTVYIRMRGGSRVAIEPTNTSSAMPGSNVSWNGRWDR